MSQATAIAQHFVVNGRDLRLDFLRGLVMLVVICVHLEYLSIFSIFMWERIGLVSSAEGFVFLSGVVLGIVYKKKLLKEGFRSTAIKLWLRAWKLYVVNMAVIVSILLLQKIPLINVSVLTHWIPIVGGEGFNLFPKTDSSLWTVISKTLLLKIGPHQFQIIGLYTALISFAPITLYALSKDKTAWVLAISWLIFIANHYLRLRLTSGNFEYAFPSLTWQVLFFNGMVVGYHHQPIFDFLSDSKNAHYHFLAALIALAFMLLALINPDPFFWPWKALLDLNKSAYWAVYDQWFSKERLGIGRLLNNAALYTVVFGFISRHWQLSYRWLGWLLIPIGQASLYVFIWHLYFVLFFSNTALPNYHSIWINSGIHLFSVLLIWLMVKKRFLFSMIPR